MGDRAYRLLWFWYTIFVALGSFFLLKMFCQWKRAGGENGFNAPAPWSPEGYEKLSSREVEGVSVKQLKIGFVIMDILCLLYAAGAVAAFFFCRSYGHTTAAESYFNCALIPAIALGALYLMWRLSILRDMKKFAAGKLHGMLHHGILFISILYLLILAAITFIETKMVISGDPEHAGRYYLAHTATAGLLIIILAVSNMIEKRTTTAVENTECSAERPAER